MQCEYFMDRNKSSIDIISNKIINDLSTINININTDSMNISIRLINTKITITTVTKITITTVTNISISVNANSIIRGERSRW